MTHRYPSIVELVSSWQPLTYRDRLTREIADARQTGDTDHPNILGDTLHAAAAAVDALDALTAIHEFIILVDSWRWHAMRAAHEAGATWQQIAIATGTTVDQACLDYLRHIQIEHVDDSVNRSGTEEDR